MLHTRIAQANARTLLAGYYSSPSDTTIEPTRPPSARQRGSAWSRRQRTRDFERDYPIFLLALASSIRTGLDPLLALQETAAIFPATTPIGQALQELDQRIRSGATEEEAVAEFGSSVDLPDVALFQAAFLLARRGGGSLGESLERLARVTRMRQSFRRKVRGALAMQRLSAIGIALCALAIAALQFVTNPTAILHAWEHPVGSIVLSVGIGLMVTGLVWMFRVGVRTV